MSTFSKLWRQTLKKWPIFLRFAWTKHVSILQYLSFSGPDEIPKKVLYWSPLGKKDPFQLLSELSLISATKNVNKIYKFKSVNGHIWTRPCFFPHTYLFLRLWKKGKVFRKNKRILVQEFVCEYLFRFEKLLLGIFWHLKGVKGLAKKRS